MNQVGGTASHVPLAYGSCTQSWPSVATTVASGRCARTAEATASWLDSVTRSWTEKPMSSRSSLADVVTNPAFIGVSEPAPR